ncbi:MAG: DUF2089 domain-containing protein [Spirochaetales bacterium]|nr:DUF2089 domain-containing protein [Spirochaetales bacterium]
MIHSWKKLAAMTDNKPIVIKKAAVTGEEIIIEGNFELPPLARLTPDEQLFAAAFLKTHGSIKQMEKIFGISYPTVKNRLNALGKKLDFIDIEVNVKPPVSEILDKLERGEIDAEQAVKEIE